MTKKLLTNQYWNETDRDRYGTDIRDNLEGYLVTSIEYLKNLFTKLVNEGWSDLSLDMSVGGYDGDEIQICVKGTRLETDKEYSVRQAKEQREIAQKRKQTKDNKEKEYALFLKLKAKYDNKV